jgi:hypothetical protein
VSDADGFEIPEEQWAREAEVENPVIHWTLPEQHAWVPPTFPEVHYHQQHQKHQACRTPLTSPLRSRSSPSRLRSSLSAGQSLIQSSAFQTQADKPSEDRQSREHTFISTSSSQGPAIARKQEQHQGTVDTLSQSPPQSPGSNIALLTPHTPHLLEDEGGYLEPRPRRNKFSASDLDVADLEVAVPDSDAAAARWRQLHEHGHMTQGLPEEDPNRNAKEPFYQNVD